MLYFVTLPEEIVLEILLLLEIDELNNLLKIKPSILSIHTIIKSKLFWINKLKNDGMNLYISFLGEFEGDYLEGYQIFLNIDLEINDFKNRLILCNSNIHMYVANNFNLKYSINNFSPNKISRLIKSHKEINDNTNCLILQYSDEKCYYDYDDLYNEFYGPTTPDLLSFDEFKMLLIKMILSDLNIYSFTDIEFFTYRY